MSIGWLNCIPVWEAFALKWHRKVFFYWLSVTVASRVLPWEAVSVWSLWIHSQSQVGQLPKHLCWKLCKTHFTPRILCKVTLLNTSECNLWLEINKQFCQIWLILHKLVWFLQAKRRRRMWNKVFSSLKSKSFIWSMIGSAQFEITTR